MVGSAVGWDTRLQELDEWGQVNRGERDMRGEVGKQTVGGCPELGATRGCFVSGAAAAMLPAHTAHRAILPVPWRDPCKPGLEWLSVSA